MSTDPITRLRAALEGRYRVERELGEGGMATVYLADDLKHERKVALKVLKPELAVVVGAERFLAEIKTTANLQHPHILPLFDSGEADGFLYYVMPYIDGETLRDRLDRERQLGVAESVRIAGDVADALDYAHRAGVIHRDIKPANILLHDGRPVVADFGIAVAVSAAGGGRMTETGMSLGTPHYMSPEQASADRDLTARSDIYALGCVLYEMLAGQPPHTGPSAQRILVQILTEEPRPLSELRHTVPSHISATVMKAIEKLPADRFATARELRDALGDPSFTHAVPSATSRGPVTAIGAARVGAPGSWIADTRSKVAVALIVGLIAVGGAALLTRGEATSAPQPTVRAEVVLEDEITWASDAPRISANGRTIAFATVNGIRVRDVDQPRFRLLPGTERAAGIDLSPDGAWVVFGEGGNVFKTSTSGSSPISLARVEGPRIDHTFWGDDGTIVFGTNQGAIWRVSDTGGDAERVADASTGTEATILPDGSAIIFTTYQRSLALLDLATREIEPLVDEGVGGMYARSGHVLYTHPQGGLFALPFDARARRVSGPPTPVLDDVGVSGDHAHFDISTNGTLFFTTGVISSNDRLMVLLNHDGVADTVPLQPTAVAQVDFSPDGNRLAYTTGVTGRSDEREVWIYDIVRESHSRLSSEGGHQPQWSPDGAHVVYSREGPDTDDEDLWVHPLDGASGPRHLRLGMASDEHAEAWPLDTLVVFQTGAGDLYTVNPFTDDPVARPFVQADYLESDFDLDPSGRFAAYGSDEYGTPEIVVRDFPAPVGKWRISDDGGVDPRWSVDGAAIYYLRQEDASIMRTGVRVGVEPTVLETEVAWGPGDAAGWRDWDFDAARSRAVVTVVARSSRSQDAAVQAWIVVNWFEELEPVVPDRAASSSPG